MGVFPQPSSAADVPFIQPVETADAAQPQGPNVTQPIVNPSFEIQVYLDDGRVFAYEVQSMSSAREHSVAIINGGYRSVQADQPNVLTHYPPHRIVKVKVVGKNGAIIPTNYTDRVLGT